MSTDTAGRTHRGLVAHSGGGSFLSVIFHTVEDDWQVFCTWVFCTQVQNTVTASWWLMSLPWPPSDITEPMAWYQILKHSKNIALNVCWSIFIQASGWLCRLVSISANLPLICLLFRSFQPQDIWAEPGRLNAQKYVEIETYLSYFKSCNMK